MTTLLADARKIQEDLTVIQTILLAAHKADMAADTWEQATSRAQAVTVNIAMQKCGKMSDGIRHKVLSELCGRDITSAYMLGKKVASELIEWLYGRDEIGRAHV